MARTVAIGIQDFEQIRKNDYFYIDKTSFIKEWWDGGDAVTLITRPRRFGKTLNMSMLEYFFSNKYKDRGDLFEGLEIWEDERYRVLQGAYPVIFLSFAGVKQDNITDTKKGINQLIVDLYNQYDWLFQKSVFTDKDRTFFDRVNADMDNSISAISIKKLCEWLYRYYGKKCIVILDEYDTPMQEAYISGFWDELVTYIRALFNNTFKTNPYMERSIMTGITRVSKESIFSDFNNPNVVTTTSNEYASSFGFTEEEVFAAMDEQGIPEEKKKVKFWYDGFTFGKVTDIYNPWSVTMFLHKREYGIHWANTSSNGLVAHLLRTGSRYIKMDFEKLLKGEPIRAAIDEQIIYNQLDDDEDAVWSLLLASGYLKVLERESYLEVRRGKRPMYTLALTNMEVSLMFENLVTEWFKKGRMLSDFVASMLSDDVEGMNHYMNDIALTTFSSFDSGNAPSNKAPERFYHGFVLGLLVDRAADYDVKSNRESGYGRYDVMLVPKNKRDVAVIMEFKVFDKNKEKSLEDTAARALEQIEKKQYAAELIGSGIPKERILKYGFAFEGKNCLICEASNDV